MVIRTRASRLGGFGIWNFALFREFSARIQVTGHDANDAPYFMNL